MSAKDRKGILGDWYNVAEKGVRAYWAGEKLDGGE